MRRDERASQASAPDGVSIDPSTSFIAAAAAAAAVAVFASAAAWMPPIS